MTSIALAAPSSLAARAGEDVAALGGTAVDAAVVMALVAMCTEPGVCAPGAGGFVTVDAGDGAPVVIDGNMAVPGIGFSGLPVSESVTMRYGGGVTTFVGPGSVAVPGGFAALATANERYGRVPWAELLGSVADLVERGFPMNEVCYSYLVDAGPLVFSQDQASRAALFDGDIVKSPGDVVVFEDLADSLRQIGEEGADTFYRGDLAGRITSDLGARGSRVTPDDFQSYQAVVREPIGATIGGWDIVANPPPAIGGVAILDALGSLAASSDPLRHEAWRNALVDTFRHRRDYESSLEDDGLDRLLAAAGLRSPSTISVAAADGDGIAVSATFSAGYGSGVIPEGTGLLMNNSLGEIELVPRGEDSLVPGRRMLSNMAPTAIRSGDDVVAIGSPGADRITSALVITLARFLYGGDSLPAAIEHPRLHPEGVDPVALAAEPGILLDDTGIRWFDEPHMFFGGVNSAGLIGGELIAHSDSRRAGVALVR